MTMIQGYTQTLLLPQLRSLALSKRQRAIVVEDVSGRLESLLFHWSDLAFRRTILTLGTEEASFWSEIEAQLANPVGLSERHKELMAALFGNG